MARTYAEATDILDRLTKTSMAWHTKDSEIANNTYVMLMLVQQRRREEERDNDMTHMKSHIDLLIKYLLAGGIEKVKVVSSKDRSNESNFE